MEILHLNIYINNRFISLLLPAHSCEREIKNMHHLGTSIVHLKKYVKTFCVSRPSHVSIDYIYMFLHTVITLPCKSCFNILYHNILTIECLWKIDKKVIRAVFHKYFVTVDCNTTKSYQQYYTLFCTQLAVHMFNKFHLQILPCEHLRLSQIICIQLITKINYQFLKKNSFYAAENNLTSVV